MPWVLVVVVAIVAAIAPARADVAARQRAGRALFANQIRALHDGNLDAFANQFIEGDRAAAMFPSSKFAAVGRKAIRAAASEWAGAGRAPTGVAVVGTPIVGVKPEDDAGTRSERLVVVTGDVTVDLKDKQRPVTLRITSILSSGFDRANANALSVVATFVTEPVEDVRLRGAGDLIENKDFDRFFDLLRFPDVLAAHFDAAVDDVVIGPSARERATGPEASKLVAGWRVFQFAVIGKPHVIKEADWTYVMGTMTRSRGGSQNLTPMNVLLVGYPECSKTCVGIDMTPHVVALHLGLPH